METDPHQVGGLGNTLALHVTILTQKKTELIQVQDDRPVIQLSPKTRTNTFRGRKQNPSHYNINTVNQKSLVTETVIHNQGKEQSRETELETDPRTNR